MAYHDGRFVGTINAQPQMVNGIVERQSYQASIDDVTDWMHPRDGLIHGNYTLRVLLPRLPKEEANKYVRAAKLKPAVTAGLKTGWGGGWIFFEASIQKLFFLDFLPSCGRA